MSKTMKIGQKANMNFKRQKTDKEYYSDNTRLSRSAIRVFLEKGPKYFKDWLEGRVEKETNKNFDIGTMIHMYLLQKNEFWKHYTVLDFEIPKSDMQKEFAKVYLNEINSMLPESQIAHIAAYRKVYNTENMSLNFVEKKAINLISVLQPYIDYLKEEKSGKIPITYAQLSKLKTYEEKVKEHKLAQKLLAPEDNVRFFSEFHINWELDMGTDKIPCKSLLDRVIFDPETRTITLVDLKTTSNVAQFDESFHKYGYLFQMMFYGEALMWYINELDPPVYEEYTMKHLNPWTIETYVVALDKQSGDVRVFELRDEDFTAISELSEETMAIEDIYWHIVNDKWDHTRAYYEGLGAERLKSKNNEPNEAV